ncbi:MAG: hypothetical protein SV487_05605 [Thermodesulfobacteriota bacterium]|nr:hypothetical protein [Thermodesulfobacteriota bacterium]
MGNPYEYPIDIHDIIVQDSANGPEYLVTRISGGITQGIFWIYANGSYQAGNTLDAAQGGWSKKLTSGEGTIFSPAQLFCFNPEFPVPCYGESSFAFSWFGPCFF